MGSGAFLMIISASSVPCDLPSVLTREGAEEVGTTLSSMNKTSGPQLTDRVPHCAPGSNIPATSTWYKCIILSTITERIYDSITEFFYKVQEERIIFIVELKCIQQRKQADPGSTRPWSSSILQRASMKVKDL